MTARDAIGAGPAPRLCELEGGRLRVAAPAKINLNLLVGPARADGLHPVDSYVAKITLYDSLTLAPRDDGQIALTCSGAECGPDEKNLALRAAKALARGRRAPGADIDLLKRIAPGKGLGGGSSDAAAVLHGLNVLWELGLAPSELARLAASLGSDVPLFLGAPAARMTGRGECIEPIAVHNFWAVLCLPDAACATAEVYRAFDDAPAEPAAQFDAALLAQPPATWRHLLRNHLAPAAERVCPALESICQEISRRAALPVHLTGSGSAMFMLCDSSDEASDVMGRIAEVNCRSIVVAANPW